MNILIEQLGTKICKDAVIANAGAKVLSAVAIAASIGSVGLNAVGKALIKAAKK